MPLGWSAGVSPAGLCRWAGAQASRLLGLGGRPASSSTGVAVQLPPQRNRQITIVGALDLAPAMWAKGPAVHPAQGAALRNGDLGRCLGLGEPRSRVPAKDPAAPDSRRHLAPLLSRVTLPAMMPVDRARGEERDGESQKRASSPFSSRNPAWPAPLTVRFVLLPYDCRHSRHVQ
jgi:hypothetical protein